MRSTPARRIRALVAMLSAGLAALVCTAAAGAAVPGDPDTTFNGTGRVTTSLAGADTATGVVVQPDGKAVAVGQAAAGGAPHRFGLARYDADGGLDTSFGTGGKVVTPFFFTPSNGDEAAAVALQDDGRIVVAGTATRTDGTAALAVARYDIDGSPDPTFGTGGKATVQVGGGTADQGTALTIEPGGKIVVAGTWAAGWAVARFTADGELDTTTFNPAGAQPGVQRFSLGDDLSDGAYAVTTQVIGGATFIVAGGGGAHDPAAGNGAADEDFALVRLTDAGALDGGFGTAGVVTTDLGGDADQVTALAIQPDDRIVAVGQSGDAAGAKGLAVARYAVDGTPDPTFHGTGTDASVLPAADDPRRGAAITPDGNLVVAATTTSGSGDVALARLTPAGALDPGFATGGVALTDVAQDQGNALAIDPNNGRVVVAGTARTSPTSASFLITRHLDALNHAPTCAAVPATAVIQDTPTDVTVSCADVDTGDTVTVVKDGDPAKGTVSLSGSTFTYTPGAGAFGTDSFSFHATDGTASTTVRTVDLTIDRPPSCAPISTTTPNHTAKVVALDCTDPDAGDTVTATASAPQHGTLSNATSASVTFTPDGDYAGAASFTVTASDGVTSTAITATVTVGANAAPACPPATITTRHDTPASLALSCTDAQGDPITLVATAPPSHGTFGFATGRYTPAAHYAGPDAFTLEASDGHGGATSVPVAVDVTNATPACASVSTSTLSHTAKVVALSCSDADGDALTYATTAGPVNGSLSAVDGASVTFTPTGDVSGDGTFGFTASDGVAGASGTSSPAVATVAIAPNAAPACGDAVSGVAHDTPVAVPLACADAEGDALAVTVAGGPAHGAATIAPGGGAVLIYTPAGGFSGADAVTVRAADGHGGLSAPATVALNVAAAGPPAPPVVKPPPGATPPAPLTKAQVLAILQRQIAPALVRGLRVALGQVTGTAPSVTLTLGPYATPAKADVKLYVRSGGRPTKTLLGKASVTLVSGKSAKLKLKLTGQGATRLKRDGKLKVTATITLTHAATGARYATKKTFNIKYKKPKKKG